MKLIGLYEHRDLHNLESNHKKFADKNGFEYKKIYINGYDEKWRNVYAILDSNPGDEFIFIDSYSFFKKLDFNFKLEGDILLQGSKDKVDDNFFIVRSTETTKIIFLNALLFSCQNMYVYQKNQYNPKVNEEYLVKYPYQQGTDYFNIDIKNQKNYNQFSNILVCKCEINNNRDHISYANILCLGKTINHQQKDLEFEVINPGKLKALVSLYTEETKHYGIISESNVSKWCIENGFTYYIYRKVPEELGNICGNWTKPYLLMNHIDDHEWLSWIDSDVIFIGKVDIDFDREMVVYLDPATWYFNSGFMTFKNTEKNKNLLKESILIFDKYEDKSSIYANGGDQKVFIDLYKKYYSALQPKNNLRINSFIKYHLGKNESEINAMIHFMGIPSHFRSTIMDYYNQISKTNYQ